MPRPITKRRHHTLDPLNNPIDHFFERTTVGIHNRQRVVPRLLSRRFIRKEMNDALGKRLRRIRNKQPLP